MKRREKHQNATKYAPNHEGSIWLLLQTGTMGATLEQANRIIVVNTLSLTSALLASTFSIIIFVLSRDSGVLLAGLIETIFFSVFLILNQYGKHRIAAISYLVIHNLALIYFAVIRGMVAEERLLVVFLFVCSLLLLASLRHIALSILVSTIILIFAKINEQHGWVSITPMDQSAMAPFHELGTVALLVLILVAISLYKHQDIKLIRELSKSNDTLEDQVKERTEQLESANANVKFFYDQLSHDMRDRLHALSEINSLLRKEIQHGRTGDLPFYAQRQQVAIFSLIDMVGDILTIKMIESGQYNRVAKETIHLGNWLKDLVSVAQFYADPHGVKIHLLIPKEFPDYIVTDSVKLDKLISNLLGNAIRHTRSVVILSTEVMEGCLLIKIKDKGDGIPPEHLRLIFDKGYSGSRGSGLGLFIVRWLCNLMDIKLTVDSAIQKGTTFSLSMPLVKGKPKDVSQPTSITASPNNLTGKRILIADDCADNRFILRKNLEAQGGIVLEARDGDELVQLAGSITVDLVIMDNQMPKLSGNDALKRIRSDERLQALPVIMMTASAPGPEVLEADADDYFFKPIKMGQLMEHASRLINRPPVRDNFC